MADENFHVYACFRGHPCILRLLQPFNYTEAMCYVFHETQSTWHPLALLSELTLCKAGQLQQVTGGT
jgi:hypothetical protein